MLRADSTPRPLVSVLIPTFNYARFLPQAIRSVLMQDYPNMEILVSDDASTDDSAAAIHELVQHDPRVRVVIQPANLGMVAHWNWCLREARGTYVKFLFGDDALNSTQSISRLVDLLEAHPQAALASCARRVMDEASRPLELWNPLRRAGLHEGRAVIGRCFLSNQNLIGEPTAVLLRRSALARGFSLAFRQLVDLELWLHLLETADLVHTSEPLVAFRRHSAQQTHVNRQTPVAQLETLSLIARFLDQPERRSAIGLSEFDYRMILFRASRYLQKATRLEHPPTLARSEVARLSPGWQLACQMRHSLLRPVENLQHSVRKRLTWLSSRPDFAASHGYLL